MSELRARVLSEIGKVVVGREEEASLLLTCFLARGHVLLEGVPGVSKTLLARAFSNCLGLKFRRVQFTPDMLPMDIIGGFVFNMKNREFDFKEGSVFTNILLADEINRAAPKVQSALLEAMQELQVTVEGRTFPLPFPFMVVATQNPADFEGVYPLPENEKDRFTMRIGFSYPTHAVEVEILKRNLSEMNLATIQPVLRPGEVEDSFKIVDDVAVSEEILHYISRIAGETRSDARISLGASPRAIVQLLQVARAKAALDGRSFVTPDDVKQLAKASLSHRIRLDRSASLKGLVQGTESVIDQVLDAVKPPR
ncbi:MAG: MoxR family ATPase [Nitrososphaerales archaeon]